MNNKELYKDIIHRLDQKKAQLKEYQQYFQIMVENEINTSCFEQNAINQLLPMIQLKAEIRDLEYWETIIRALVNKEE